MLIYYGPVLCTGDKIVYKGNKHKVLEIKIDPFGLDDLIKLDNGSWIFSSQVENEV